jgi:integrase
MYQHRIAGPLEAGSISGNVYVKQGKRGPSWYLRARLPREIRKRLGPAWMERGRPPAGYYTRRTAEAELQALLADARRGSLPDALARRSGVIFRDASAEYLRYVEHDRKRRPSTVADYRGVVDFALDAEFGDLPLEEVTEQRIDAYRARLVDEGELSDRTINKRLVILHGVLRRAMKVFGLRENAAALVERQPLRDSGDFSVLSPAEVEALARAAQSDQDAAFFRVASFTGLRLGELRALRWMDVDFANRVVHVKRSYTHGEVGTPKSGRVRSVPLIDQAAKALDGLSKRGLYTGPEDLVFVENELGDNVDDWRLRRRFQAALDRAKLPRLRLHDLRHTFGTIAVRAFPLTDVKAYMGHADIQTTMRYVHFVPQDDAADKLTRIVASAELPPVAEVSQESVSVG